MKPRPTPALPGWPLAIALGLVACAPAWAADAHGKDKPLRPSLAPIPEQRLEAKDVETRYGIPAGHCNRLMVGAVLAHTIAPGERIGGGGERATPVGRLTGVLLGSASHPEVEDAERGCAQQVLEYGGDDQPVGWRHAPIEFSMRVRAATGESATRCRPFVFEVKGGGLLNGRVETRACRVSDDEWQVQR